MIGAVSKDDKAGKISDWFSKVTDDSEVWERRRKLAHLEAWLYTMPSSEGDLVYSWNKVKETLNLLISV
eukprot:1377813-Ditylum_brightwellii.AAC.1